MLKAWRGGVGAAPHYSARPEPNFRSVHALIGPEDKIIVPKDCAGAVQPEGQLAVVIGKKAGTSLRKTPWITSLAIASGMI